MPLNAYIGVQLLSVESLRALQQVAHLVEVRVLRMGTYLLRAEVQAV